MSGKGHMNEDVKGFASVPFSWAESAGCSLSGCRAQLLQYIILGCRPIFHSTRNFEGAMVTIQTTENTCLHCIQ